MAYQGERVEKRISRSGKNLDWQMWNTSFGAIPEDEEEHEIVNRYPRLIRGDGRVRYSRYTGEVFITTYRDLKEGRELPTSEADYTHRRGEIKEGRPEIIKELRWNGSKTIEDAIHGMEHVAEAYTGDGKQIQRTKIAIKAVQRIMHAFRADEDVTEERLEEVHLQTMEDLGEARFFNVNKEIRKMIAAQVAAASEKDSLGRVNKLISLSVAASAMLKTTQEQLLASYVRQKFPYLKEALMLEREDERFNIAQEARIIEAISRLHDSNKSHIDIGHAITRAQSQFNRRRLRVAPYLPAERYALASIIGKGAEDNRPVLENWFDKATLDNLFRRNTLRMVFTDPNRSAMDRWEEINNRLSDAQIVLETALEIGDAKLNREPVGDD